MTVAGGALLGGVVLAWLAARLEHPGLILVAVALPMLLLVLYRGGRIEYGVLGIVLVAATVRFSLPTGTQSRIPMSLVITAGITLWWLSSALVVEKRLRLNPSPTNVPLLGFVVTCVLSYFWGNAFRDPLVVTWSSWPFVQLGGLAVMVLLPAAFLVTANRLQEVKWVAWLVVIFLGVGTVAIVGYYLHLPVHFLQVRPMFPTWVICLAYALALSNRKLPLWLRGLFLLLVGAWAYRVFVVEFRWLSAWVPTGLAIGIISALRSRKALLILLVLALLYTYTHWDALMENIAGEQEESGVTRLDAWMHNWQVTGKHLLFGVGPAGYAVYYMSYFPTEAMATHSTYVDILSQTGVVGFAFFIWFFVALGLCAWRLWRRVRKRGDFTEAFALAALGGYVGTIAAMGLGDWLIPFVYTQTISGFDYASYTWVLMGAMVALSANNRESGCLSKPE